MTAMPDKDPKPDDYDETFSLSLMMPDDHASGNDASLRVMRRQIDELPPIELPRGMSVKKALELLSNACCGD